MIEEKGKISERIPYVVTLPEGKENLPVMILCHGSASSKDEVGGLFVELSQKLSEKGIASIRFDFANGGERANEVFSYNYAVQDLNEILEYISSRKEINKDKISILGYSLGARIAMDSCIQREGKYSSIVIWSGACKDGREQFGEFFGENDQYYAEAKEHGASEIPLDFREEPMAISLPTYEVIKDSHISEGIAKLKQPTLVVCGKEDDVVGIDSARELAGSMQYSELVEVDGADHIYHVFETSDQKEALLNATVEFADKELNMTKIMLDKLCNVVEYHENQVDTEKLQNIFQIIKRKVEGKKYLRIIGEEPEWLVAALATYLNNNGISVEDESGIIRDINGLIQSDNGNFGIITSTIKDKVYVICTDCSDLDKDEIIVPQIISDNDVYIEFNGKVDASFISSLSKTYAKENNNIFLKIGNKYVCVASGDLSNIGITQETKDILDIEDINGKEEVDSTPVIG